jgi:hypothetical protein
MELTRLEHGKKSFRHVHLGGRSRMISIICIYSRPPSTAACSGDSCSERGNITTDGRVSFANVAIGRHLIQYRSVMTATTASNR